LYQKLWAWLKAKLRRKVNITVINIATGDSIALKNVTPIQVSEIWPKDVEGHLIFDVTFRYDEFKKERS